MKKSIINGLHSRKLWLALIAGFIAFGNGLWGWGLTTGQVWTVIAPLLSFIGVEGVKDITSTNSQ